ncbi:LuxR family transcriptional regulator [Prauserella marina]|nr:LuxR family transcriptional regulator [Prauserella marina]ASR35402.1 LuxR family transcriptional regulator [Prauserella marina]
MYLVPRLGSGIPMVGRARELRALHVAFDDADARRARAVLVSGDAGVGKTRLLAELTEYARSRDAVVLGGRCLDLRDGGLPYLPFAEALAALLPGAEGNGGGAPDSGDPGIAEVIAGALRARPALTRLLPSDTVIPAHAAHGYGQETESGPRPRPRVEQDVGQLQLYDAVLGVLTDIAAHRPVVLVVEDLHWADGSTRDLLSFLLSRLRSQRLLVVGSYREEDVHRRHPLRALLAELVRLPTVERIELRPMSDVDTRMFVRALAEEPLAPSVVTTLARRSEGNPFFVEELLASAASHHDLPSGLADLLLARLERLAPDTRRVLRLIAVASDGVRHAALAMVSGLGDVELDEALREAVQHHVLVVERGYYQFRHALLSEAIYGDLLPGERIRMHAAYAARLRSKPRGKGHAARLAYHSLESKDVAAALPALVSAAEEAEGLGAPGSALRHLEQALEIWDVVGEADRPEGWSEHKLLMEASYFAGTSGEPERAIAFARSAVDILGPGDPPDLAASTWRRLAEALTALDATFDEAVAAIAHAWSLVADAEPSRRRAWVLATRAQILRNQELRDEALWSAQTAVADARAVGVPAAEAAALINLGALADSTGNADEARARLKEAEAKARAAGAVDVELRAIYFHALSYDDAAELRRARDLYDKAVAWAEETGLTWSAVGLAARQRQVSLAYISGDWPDQESAAEPAASVSSTVTAIMSAAWVHLAIARGRFAEAEGVVNALRGLWKTDAWIATAASSAGAELAFWQGNYREAARRSDEGLGWVRDNFAGLVGIRIGAVGVEACAAWAATARLHGDESSAEEAAAMGERLLAQVRECVAEVRPRTGALGPEGRAWLLRAESAATGLRSPADPSEWAETVAAFGYGAVYEQAISRLHHAEALLAAGDAATAKAELGAAHEVASKLAAAPLLAAVTALARRAKIELPGLRQRKAVVDLLTERETAVLEQVALGRTNRQVGEELFISEKTVSVHLSRAMAKLGASRRAEAVAIAYERGLLSAAPAP